MSSQDEMPDELLAEPLAVLSIPAARRVSVLTHREKQVSSFVLASTYAHTISPVLFMQTSAACVPSHTMLQASNSPSACLLSPELSLELSPCSDLFPPVLASTVRLCSELSSLEMLSSSAAHPKQHHIFCPMITWSLIYLYIH